MKISDGDRYEALRRLEKYEQEWEILQKISSNADYDAFSEKLMEKYHVERLPLPLKYSNKERIRYKHTPVEVIPTLSGVKKAEDNPPEFESMAATLFWLNNQARRLTLDDFLERKRYLHLRIDLTESIPILQKAIERQLKDWKKKIQPLDGRKKGKPKTMTYDPWEIYNLNQSGLNLLEIARKLHGKDLPRGKRTPAYSKELWPPYKRVKRAYGRAVKIIQTVLKESMLPLILP